ncbi:hypothetical protein Ocin01_11128 [Orchesella cincta]|uniref:Ig-like domain-containing protein n=1 Tax=Orchesella cincta TaxID=48709 RepID=A0A1D2MS55_ORCCI|nr:hypothetical protein Ocin01_11128 [Orchesella cincta]
MNQAEEWWDSSNIALLPHMKFNVGRMDKVGKSFVLAPPPSPRVSAVRINSLSVPHIVRNGTEESVILDCDYSIEDHERKGLVVKWYFSNQESPVYQWIPNSKPISLGILKGKLNLDYQADVDNYKMKRALQIIRPTTELSGNWMCHVSTFEGEAMKASRMVVFGKYGIMPPCCSAS